MKCYRSDCDPNAKVVVCLNSLAMGDNEAVEYGQAGHLLPIVASRAIYPDELVFFHSRLPRGKYFAGVIQDDHAAFEVETATLNSTCKHVPSLPFGADTTGSVRFDVIDEIYGNSIL